MYIKLASQKKGSIIGFAILLLRAVCLAKITCTTYIEKIRDALLPGKQATRGSRRYTTDEKGKTEKR